MRYLHVVGISEKFIASGTYMHEHSYGDTWRQEWNIHELPDGARLIRIDDDQRPVNGRSILIEAWVSPIEEGGRIARMDFDVYGGQDDPLRHLRATYNFFEDRLEVGRTLNRGERSFSEMALERGTLVSSSARILQAYMLTELIGSPQARTVVSHNQDFSGDEAFSPTLRQCSAEVETEGEVRLGSKHHRAQKVHLHCEHADHARTIWLDDKGVILRESSPGDGSAAIILTDYAHS